MRLAVISDIHGNLDALEAVLQHASQAGATQIVNLGDSLSGPLQPAETADRLIDLNIPSIRGNHERQLLEHSPDVMGASDRFAHERLDARHRAWLRQLPVDAWVAEDVFACHGTPASDLAHFLYRVDAYGLRESKEIEIRRDAGEVRASLILCGHTHLQRHCVLEDGRQVLNPGSVGLPAYADDHPIPHLVESGTPHARYAICGRSLAGWTIDLHEVTYDWDAAAARARGHGRPDWAAALSSGKAHL